MLNLIRKDLLLHKTESPLYVSTFVAVLVLQAWRGFSQSLYITLTCVYGTIFPAVFITLEDRFRTGAFNCSLPVTRTTIVRGKYVTSWALAVLLTLIGLVLYSVIAAKSFGVIWAISTVGQALVTLSLGLGITLPVLLRWGWWDFIGGCVALQVLWIVTVLIIQAHVPDVQLMNSAIAISDLFAHAQAQLGASLFLTVIGAAGAVLNLVSCKNCGELFAGREF